MYLHFFLCCRGQCCVSGGALLLNKASIRSQCGGSSPRDSGSRGLDWDGPLGGGGTPGETPSLLGTLLLYASSAARVWPFVSAPSLTGFCGNHVVATVPGSISRGAARLNGCLSHIPHVDAKPEYIRWRFAFLGKHRLPQWEQMGRGSPVCQWGRILHIGCEC